MKSKAFPVRASAHVTPYSRLVLLAALSLLFVGTLLIRRNTAASPKTTFTAQQILDRSTPICADLAPDRQDLRMSVDYIRGDDVKRQTHGRWNVSCTDASDHEVASMQWEDGTGTLLTAGTPSQPRSRMQPLLRTPQQALASARGWLARLWHTGSSEEHLPNLSRREYTTPQWVVVYRFVDHEVVLHIDEYNGGLTYAALKPPDYSGTTGFRETDPSQ